MNNINLTANNTLAEQLANMNLSQENIIAILIGLQNAIVSNNETTTIQLVNKDGSTYSVEVKSIPYIISEINRINNNISELSNLNPESATSIIDESGQKRKIIVTNFNKTLYGDINNISKTEIVNVDKESLIWDLMYPSTKMIFTLPNDLLMVDEVVVHSFRFSDTQTFDRVKDGMSYAEVLSLSNQKKIIGTWFKDIHKTQKRVQRYYGVFDVIQIDNYNTDGSVDCTVNTTRYNDANSIDQTRELYKGDILVNKIGNSKFEIISVDHFKMKLKLKQIAGIAQLLPSIGGLQYLYEIENEERELALPIHGNEKSIVFFTPVNPLNSVAGMLTRGYTVDTSTLMVYEAGNPIYFDTYYTNKVINIGTYLQQLISDNAIAFSNGIKPDKPTLKSDYLKVLQINKHLAENSRIDKINKLSEEKEKIFGDLTNVNSQISTVNSRINAGRYRSLADRTVDENKLKTLISRKQSLTALYGSIVNDIDSKVRDEDLSSYTPKFRVRGFFPIQNPISSSVTRNQHIIKYLIQYRYCSPNTDTSESTTIKYLSADGNELHGTFSSWNIQESTVLKKVRNVDETITWATNNTESGDELNINQIDIPINSGESVEIRIKALSEAGYPVTFTESEWSDVVRIDFPSSLQNYTSLSNIVDKNEDDKRKVDVEQMLSDIGINDHLSTSFKEQDKYFGHTAHQIASGFKSNEQSTISLFEYLTSLTNQITTLKAKVERASIEATVEIVDADNNAYTVQNFMIMQLYAGAYMDNLNLSDQTNWGKIIEKTFYIRISNNNASALDLLSPCAGDIKKNVDSTNTDLYFPLVHLNKLSVDDKMVQYNGQIIYSRFKDVANQTIGSDLYVINTETSAITITDTDKDATAQEIDKTVVDSTLSRCKLLNTNGNDFVAISTSHPFYVSYLGSPTIENQTILQNEFNRLSVNFNTYVKANNIQNAYSENRSASFSEYDKYAIGKNTCGARLFMRYNSVQNIQVNGSSSNSVRILNPGSTNTILIPIVYQYRMTDAIGNIDGTGLNTIDNIEYRKKIGIQLMIGQNPFNFDVEVVSRLRSNTITETSATKLNTIIDSINTSDDVTPSII